MLGAGSFGVTPQALPADVGGKGDPRPDDTARAKQLLTAFASADDQHLVVSALARGAGDPLARALLLEMSTMPIVPAWAGDAVVVWSPSVPDADFEIVTSALASIRTRSAAWALLRMGERGKTPGATATALSALVDLSGRDEPRFESPQWSQWLSTLDTLSDEQWRARAMSAVADRAKREAAHRADAVARLVESLRKVHLATPMDQRSAFIVELLKDQFEDVQRLGLELAARELASANPLGPEVGQTLASLLVDRARLANPSLRAECVTLLNQLAAPEAADIASGALLTESDARVAAALLRLACRWPEPSSLAPALYWLGRTTSTPDDGWTSEARRVCRDAAVELCWHLHRAGVLYERGDRDRVLEAVRSIPLTELSGPGCQLRPLLGSEWDREQVASLLVGPDAGQRLSAAEALALYADQFDALMRGVTSDAALVDAATRAVQVHRPDADGFAALEAATRDKPLVRRIALTSVAQVLGVRELLASALLVASDPVLQESVLATLTVPQRIMSERLLAENVPIIAGGLVQLAELRLAIARPADAIAALEALPDLDQFRTPGELARLRTIAFIELNRIDQALQESTMVQPPPGTDAGGTEIPGVDAGAARRSRVVDVWLEALDRVADRPFAPDVVSAIELHFAVEMSIEQVAVLSTLKAKVGVPSVDPK